MMIQIHGVGCKFLKSQHLPTFASTKPLRSCVFAIQRLGFASSQLAGSSSDLMVPLKNIIPKVLGSPRCSTLLNRLKTPLDHSVLANSLFGPEVFRWFLGFVISFPCEYFLVTCAVTWGPHYPCQCHNPIIFGVNKAVFGFHSESSSSLFVINRSWFCRNVHLCVRLSKSRAGPRTPNSWR